jgi:hypothetical protein
MVRASADTFLFGLSSLPADVRTNLDIMRANFIEVPIVYKSGQYTTLTFEKGSTGTPVFARAMAAWGDN